MCSSWQVDIEGPKTQGHSYTLLRDGLVAVQALHLSRWMEVGALWAGLDQANWPTCLAFSVWVEALQMHSVTCSKSETWQATVSRRYRSGPSGPLGLLPMSPMSGLRHGQ